MHARWRRDSDSEDEDEFESRHEQNSNPLHEDHHPEGNGTGASSSHHESNLHTSGPGTPRSTNEANQEDEPMVSTLSHILGTDRRSLTPDARGSNEVSRASSSPPRDRQRSRENGERRQRRGSPGHKRDHEKSIFRGRPSSGILGDRPPPKPLPHFPPPPLPSPGNSLRSVGQGIILQPFDRLPIPPLQPTHPSLLPGWRDRPPVLQPVVQPIAVSPTPTPLVPPPVLPVPQPPMSQVAPPVTMVQSLPTPPLPQPTPPMPHNPRISQPKLDSYAPEQPLPAFASLPPQMPSQLNQNQPPKSNAWPTNRQDPGWDQSWDSLWKNPNQPNIHDNHTQMQPHVLQRPQTPPHVTLDSRFQSQEQVLRPPPQREDPPRAFQTIRPSPSMHDPRQVQLPLQSSSSLHTPPTPLQERMPVLPSRAEPVDGPSRRDGPFVIRDSFQAPEEPRRPMLNPSHATSTPMQPPPQPKVVIHQSVVRSHVPVLEREARMVSSVRSFSRPLVNNHDTAETFEVPLKSFVAPIEEDTFEVPTVDLSVQQRHPHSRPSSWVVAEVDLSARHGVARSSGQAVSKVEISSRNATPQQARQQTVQPNHRAAGWPTPSAPIVLNSRMPIAKPSAASAQSFVASAPQAIEILDGDDDESEEDEEEEEEEPVVLKHRSAVHKVQHQPSQSSRQGRTCHRTKRPRDKSKELSRKEIELRAKLKRLQYRIQ